MDDRFKDYYKDIAYRTSLLSRARRLKVGAIIVKDDKIISFGYNGTPKGMDNNCEYVAGYNADGTEILKTKPEVLHAELNSITKLAKSTESGDNSIMFVTHGPCLECAKCIYQTGIKEVYYSEDYRDDTGIKFLQCIGVSVQKLT